MAKTRRGIFSMALLVAALAMVLALPARARALQKDVRVSDYATAQGATTAVSGITLGEVDEPRAGEPLDDVAVVTTKEDQSWEIPVLWVGSDLNLATEAVEGRSYLPVLAFYFPADYAVADVDDMGAFAISFSDSLAKLFGDEKVISVYDSGTGITYILPSSLRSFFVHPDAAAPSYPVAEGSSDEESGAPAQTEQNQLARLVDIYCAQTAKDALSQEDLEYLVDLIINRLEPQAVELLREKFPAFADAAANGEIGTRIGLYIYFGKGDQDGDEAHESADSDALAYVAGRPFNENGQKKYKYLLGVNVESISKKDSDGNFVLVRSGEDFDTLRNTMVHELFHAYMDDYNRTGMVGGTSEETLITDLESLTNEQREQFFRVHYPYWFIEGTASAVENCYQYRHQSFELLRSAPAGTTYAEGSQEAIFVNFLQGSNDGELLGYQLPFAAGGVEVNGQTIDTTTSRYVSGYLAVLYLGEMASASSGAGSSISVENGVTTISSEKIRLGLNSILERMHKGETLDAVIADISKTKEGKSLYTSTDDFEGKFVSGTVTMTAAGAAYSGDESSLAFVTTFLNYMHAIDKMPNRANLANGSILFDFDLDYAAPLDPDKSVSSDRLVIIEDNSFVESTVPNSTALAGGGKSESAAAEQLSAADDSIALAAKAPDVLVASDAAEAPAEEDAEAVASESAQEPETADDAAAAVAEPEEVVAEPEVIVESVEPTVESATDAAVEVEAPAAEPEAPATEPEVAEE